jgi:hypothetical protein
VPELANKNLSRPSGRVTPDPPICPASRRDNARHLETQRTQDDTTRAPFAGSRTTRFLGHERSVFTGQKKGDSMIRRRWYRVTGASRTGAGPYYCDVRAFTKHGAVRAARATEDGFVFYLIERVELHPSLNDE